MRKKIDWDKIDTQDLIQGKINRMLDTKDTNIVVDVMLLTCARILGDNFIPVAKDFVNFVKEEEVETA